MGYNEKSDIYSLGVVVCEIANGLIPFSEMPNTYMLLEKMKGTEPKLLDSSTYEIGKKHALKKYDQFTLNRAYTLGLIVLDPDPSLENSQ